MTDSTSLEAQVGARLTARGLTVCAAESCTGGLVLSRLTDVSGSSAYVLGGIVSYSNEAKHNLLHVSNDLLMTHGAVSEPVARAMAEGARAVFDTDYALSVTGIAGPGGGTADKPVGLTFIGLAGREGIISVERHVWEGDRIANKLSSANAALSLLLRTLQSAG